MFIRSLLIITSVFLSTSTALNAQFIHKYELLVEKSSSFITDNIRLTKGHIDYYENTSREGKGITAGLVYNFDVYPLGMYLGYERNVFNKYSINSNITINDNSQELKINSLDFNVRYIFNKRSTIKPIVYAGLNINNFKYKRTGVSCKYINFSDLDDTEYANLNEISWRYHLIESDFNSLGVNFGAILNIKITDKIGIYGSIKFKYIPQNKTEWIDKNTLVKTIGIGLNYRLLKRKNNLLL